MSYFRTAKKIIRYLLIGANALVGIIVGGIFGTLATALLIASFGEGTIFYENWSVGVVPGAICGAVVGIKAWPLMIGIFLGADADADLVDFDGDLFESPGSVDATPDDKGGSW